MAKRLEICTYGHPVLTQKAEPVDKVCRAVRELAEGMFGVMRDRKGIGLAAQQVGHTIRIMTIDMPLDYDRASDGDSRLNPNVELSLVAVNPEIIESSGSISLEEGCLSFPNINAPIERAYEVKVRFLDLKGRLREMTVKGMLARVFQHELDHLNGVLFVERMGALKRLSLLPSLNRLRRETAERLTSSNSGLPV